MPKVAVPNRLLLIVAKRTLIFFIIIVTSYLFVTTVMTGLFPSYSSSSSSSSSSSTDNNNLPSTSTMVAGGASDNGDNNNSAKKNNLDDFKKLVVNKNKRKQQQSKDSQSALDVNGSSSPPLTNEESVDNSKVAVDAKSGTHLVNLMDDSAADAEDGPVDHGFRNKPNESVHWRNIHVVKNPVQKIRRKSNELSSHPKFPFCPEVSPDLTGKIKQAVLLMTNLKESEIIQNHSELQIGGHWKPKHCKSRHKVAIIVPFRDRQSHLNRLIDFLIPMLQRQQLDFRFIVTEQYGHDLFNKGRIMNAAFEVAETLGVDCVLFHDVDMFPQDDRNFYGCPNEPRHIGAFVNTLGYELWYDYIVGGVLAIQTDHYKQVNGYSNMYWAWGGEDDDMGYRILANNFTIERPDPILGRMTMLKHVKRSRTAPSLIHDLLKTAQVRWTTDGLNDTQWNIIKIIRKPLYYHLYVDVGTPPNEWREEKATTAPPKKKA